MFGDGKSTDAAEDNEFLNMTRWMVSKSEQFSAARK